MRKSQRPKKLSDVEESVRARLQEIIGASVSQLDDNSIPSTPDLLITYPDGRTAPVEVTEALHEEHMAAVRSKGFASWDAPGLANSWMVTGETVLPPNWRVLKHEAEALLRKLELAQVFDFHPGITKSYYFRAMLGQEPDLSASRALFRLAELHVPSGAVYPVTRGVPEVMTSLVQGGTWDMTANAVPEWASKFVADPKRADNIRKINRGGSEAHLAIVVHSDEAGEGVVRGIADPNRARILPDSNPTIPETITDLWLSASFDSGSVLHYRHGSSWVRHDKK